MAKSEHFTSLLNQTTKAEFSRALINDSELNYEVTLMPESGKVTVIMKRNNNGHWQMEDRMHLPPWVINFEPEFIKAIKRNEA